MPAASFSLSGRIGRVKHLGYLERSLSRPNQARLVFEGALVGLAGGGIVVLYRMALSGA